MSVKLAPGLMRLSLHGEIVRCNYNFDTRSIGDVQVSLPVAYAEPYIEAACQWTRHDLWKAMVSMDEAVAVLIVNNVFLVTVTTSYLKIQTKSEKQRPQIAEADTHLLFSPRIPIGFVRTAPEIKDVNVPPYALFMDEHWRVSINGEPPKSLPDAVQSTDMQLYKKLITTSHSAVYMSSEGPKYL